MKKKNIHDLKNEARDESYVYFNQHIRALPKDVSGNIDATQAGFVDNDVDAFRHAYVSGVFVLERGVTSAKFYGFLQEQRGNYDGYTLASINDGLTPMSKPDGSMDNNLG